MHLENAVLITLAYSAQFSDPLSLEEISTRLVLVSASSAQIKRCLDSLEKRGKIVCEGGLYSLSSVENMSQWVVQKHSRLEESARKYELARVAQAALARVPFVRAVALTGSVAARSARSRDDIDFMIITSPAMLWLVRPLVLAISRFYVRYRPRTQEIKNSWCFNLFITTQTLAMSKRQHTLYTAYEVCQADFVYSTPGVERAFLLENRWVSEFLPHYYAAKVAATKERKLAGATQVLTQHLMHLFELCLLPFSIGAYILECVYMSSVRTREVISFQKAFFHPRATGESVFEGVQASLRMGSDE